MSSHTKLTRTDRNCIEKMQAEKKSIVEIAQHLGVHRTTIDRELKRVPENLLYDATTAQQDAVIKRSACGAKSKYCDEIAYQVECDLEDTWSPEQIAMQRQTLAFKTIYNWIEAGLIHKTVKCLRQKGRRRKKQAETRGKMSVGHTIDQRPAIINDRSEFGHWELDTIVSGKGKSKACEATFLERKTRFYWTIPMRDRTAASMTAAIKRFLTTIGHDSSFLSATVDRGKEFACWPTIEQQLGIHVYFCDPHAPWQRGSNENANGLYREFFPKGTDFSKVSASERLDALRKINHRPKKTLNSKNCFEVFQAEMLRLI